MADHTRYTTSAALNTAPPSPESFSYINHDTLPPQFNLDGPSSGPSFIKPPGGDRPLFHGSIEQQLRTVLKDVDVDECEADGENAFFVADLSEIYRQHQRWLRALPRVIPFYAVKCNPDPYVLRLLANLGSGFDCASNGEIQAVLNLGVSPSRIIYANPCKAASFVRNAAANNVSLTTFDNIDELHKMKRFHPTCKLVVRILTDDSKSACQLGLKFGAPLDTVPRLLAKARELELDVVGVSFHVGSGCYDPSSFGDAVKRARLAFEYGRDAGYTFDLLDVGGGYDHDNFETIADVLRPAIDEYFPDKEFAPGGTRVEGHVHGLRIIAEPGRYYVQKAFTLACNIIAKRDGTTDELNEERPEQELQAEIEASPEKPQIMYYQNDGVYGAFNNIMFDHQTVHPQVLTLQREFVYPAAKASSSSDRTFVPISAASSDSGVDMSSPSSSIVVEGSSAVRMRPSSIWGPTCDSIDLVVPLHPLPDTLQVGDWLVYENMGAYTICAASNFNGLRRSEVRYTVGGGGAMGGEDREGRAEDARRVAELMMLERR